MRRAYFSFFGALALGFYGLAAGATVSSPYPATLPMRQGLSNSTLVKALPWGTALTVAQARWVTFRSAGPGYKWGVWKENDGEPPMFPVRSTDGGVHWTAAGPMLATDWAGGGLFFVTKVIPESASAVVMVSNSVIDVTTDSGRHWFQYLNPGDNWTIAGHAVKGGGIGLSVDPTSYAALPKGSYAIYVLDVTKHRWLRTSQSLG